MKTLPRANFAAYCLGSIAIFTLATLLPPAPAQEQTASPAELRTSRAFDAVRGNPLELEAFLVDLPKGTDLHNHLTGAVYAETLIRNGAEDQLCVNPTTLSFAKPDPKSNDTTKGPACESGNVPAAQ